MTRSERLRRLADDLEFYEHHRADDMIRAVGVELVDVGRELLEDDEDGMTTAPEPGASEWVAVAIAALILAAFVLALVLT